jgi:hypothetical protein
MQQHIIQTPIDKEGLKMTYEYTVVGGGPAGILAIVRILEKLLQTESTLDNALHAAKKICWVDNGFNVGAFGEQWKNVPGNTNSSKYKTVYKDMLNILNIYGVASPTCQFDLDLEAPDYPSLLKTAAAPLRWMTEQLMQLIIPIKGNVTKIISADQGLQLYIQTAEKPLKISTKRSILAIGGLPKELPLSNEEAYKCIPLEIALDLDLMKKFIDAHPDLLKKCVLVQGSSHSAALAVWNLLACGATVKQVMNKPYFYYRVEKDLKGVSHVYHENDGLKGKVAEFTRELETGKIYADKWSCEIRTHENITNYSDYSYMIFAIGLKAANTLTINGISSIDLHYNLQTSETEVCGVFVVGAGHPPAASDGSKNVGISKFWPDMGKTMNILIKTPSNNYGNHNSYPIQVSKNVRNFARL